MALWGGRFEAGVAEVTQEFGASLPVDKHLYKQDIAGSKAHAKMLAAQGIISAEDEQAIAKGLTEIEQDIDAGNFTFDINDEDIHMSIESELTRRIGEAGKRLHTGRSRNDQVATDTRLGVKALAKELMEANLELRHVLMDAAKKYDKVILPGYTHMQHAQPVLLSHHLLAYSWMFARDFTRLKAAFDAADNCPLGAAALAGTSYPLDRQMTAAELGFAGVIPNSLDAVSDRDFLLDLHTPAPSWPCTCRVFPRRSCCGRAPNLALSRFPTRTPPARPSCRRRRIPTLPSLSAARAAVCMATWCSCS